MNRTIGYYFSGVPIGQRCTSFWAKGGKVLFLLHSMARSQNWVVLPRVKYKNLICFI